VKRAVFVVLVLLTLALLAESQMTANHWQQQYGASRRKIDRAILEAAERAIPDDPIAPDSIPDPDGLTAAIAQQIQSEHDRIARAFGRPVMLKGH
jgi:hypothetical protein